MIPSRKWKEMAEVRVNVGNAFEKIPENPPNLLILARSFECGTRALLQVLKCLFKLCKSAQILRAGRKSVGIAIPVEDPKWSGPLQTKRRALLIGKSSPTVWELVQGHGFAKRARGVPGNPWYTHTFRDPEHRPPTKLPVIT